MPVTRRQFINYAVTGTAAMTATNFSLAQKREVIKPNKLEPGMTVGLVSPASNAEEDEDILASIEFVRSLGFEAKASPNFESGPGRVERENRVTRISAGIAEGRLIGRNLSFLEMAVV